MPGSSGPAPIRLVPVAGLAVMLSHVKCNIILFLKEFRRAYLVLDGQLFCESGAPSQEPFVWRVQPKHHADKRIGGRSYAVRRRRFRGRTFSSSIYSIGTSCFSRTAVSNERFKSSFRKYSLNAGIQGYETDAFAVVKRYLNDRDPLAITRCDAAQNPLIMFRNNTSHSQRPCAR